MSDNNSDPVYQKFLAQEAAKQRLAQDAERQQQAAQARSRLEAAAGRALEQWSRVVGVPLPESLVWTNHNHTHQTVKASFLNGEQKYDLEFIQTYDPARSLKVYFMGVTGPVVIRTSQDLAAAVMADTIKRAELAEFRAQHARQEQAEALRTREAAAAYTQPVEEASKARTFLLGAGLWVLVAGVSGATLYFGYLGYRWLAGRDIFDKIGPILCVMSFFVGLALWIRYDDPPESGG